MLVVCIASWARATEIVYCLMIVVFCYLSVNI